MFEKRPLFSFLVVSHDSIKGCVRPLVGQLVGLSVGPSVRNAFVSASRDEPANNLFCVHELVFCYLGAAMGICRRGLPRERINRKITST